MHLTFLLEILACPWIHLIFSLKGRQYKKKIKFAFLREKLVDKLGKFPADLTAARYRQTFTLEIQCVPREHLPASYLAVAI